MPYRETTICFVLFEGKIVSKMTKSYIKFPGGGVDANEKPEQAVKRELIEEIGAKIIKLHHLAEICIDWHPEWVENDPKRM